MTIQVNMLDRASKGSTSHNSRHRKMLNEIGQKEFKTQWSSKAIKKNTADVIIMAA